MGKAGPHRLRTKPVSEWTRDEIRMARTYDAVQRVGGATLGSAITTLGSSFFLMFCVLRVFFKLGVVVFMVTLLSIVFALLVLPAILLLFGPLESFDQTVKRVCQRLRRRGRGKDSVEEASSGQ